MGSVEPPRTHSISSLNFLNRDTRFLVYDEIIQGEFKYILDPRKKGGPLSAFIDVFPNLREEISEWARNNRSLHRKPKGSRFKFNPMKTIFVFDGLDTTPRNYEGLEYFCNITADSVRRLHITISGQEMFRRISPLLLNLENLNGISIRLSQRPQDTPPHTYHGIDLEAFATEYLITKRAWLPQYTPQHMEVALMPPEPWSIKRYTLKKWFSRSNLLSKASDQFEELVAEINGLGNDAISTLAELGSKRAERRSRAWLESID